MQILNSEQVKQKTKRLAVQILENNLKEKEIILAGINNNGRNFAKKLAYHMSRNSDAKITISNIKLNPAKPLADPITIDKDISELKNKVVVIVDDVANTGRTLFFAFKPLLDVLCKKIEIAVLINRTHKSYPITPNYIGLSLATTVKEHIEVSLTNTADQSVFLV